MKIRNAWQSFYLTDSRTFPQNFIEGGKLNFRDSCLFYFLEACICETSFHITVKIGAVFSLGKKKKKSECKSPKIPNKSLPPIHTPTTPSKTRTIKHEQKKKMKNQSECKPKDEGAELRRRLMRAFSLRHRLSFDLGYPASAFLHRLFAVCFWSI